MKKLTNIKLNYITAFVLLITGVAIFMAIQNLYFFDEDVFVANGKSAFIKEIWERAVIVKFIFLVENSFNGANPRGYHVTNLFFHLANSLVALLVLKELLKTIGDLKSVIIQGSFLLFFLLSPIHSEPLCYILGRVGEVAAFFLLLSLLFFLRADLKNKTFLFFSLLSFLFGLFCYEISWTLPFIILSLTIFLSYVKKEPLKKNVKFALPYFIVFAIWFIIKVAVIDKFVVTDYKDDDFLKVRFITIAKNNAVLFLRNFIPPFKNTVTFLCIGVVFITMLAFGLLKIYRQNRRLFHFLFLLLVLTVFSFVAASLIGIDSHDSESERYIYFSSVFALMFLSVFLTGIFKNKTVLFAIIFAIASYYCYTLFTTIGYYKKASDFSQLYLRAVNEKIGDNQTVFFINQPSQYKGALLFRAKSRLDDNTNLKVSILQEYFNYLYNKKESCSTLSAKELINVPVTLNTIEIPIDSLVYFFPEVENSQHSIFLPAKDKTEHSAAINPPLTYVALKDSTVFFFK